MREEEERREREERRREERREREERRREEREEAAERRREREEDQRAEVAERRVRALQATEGLSVQQIFGAVDDLTGSARRLIQTYLRRNRNDLVYVGLASSFDASPAAIKAAAKAEAAKYLGRESCLVDAPEGVELQFTHVDVAGVTDFEFVASRAETEVHGWGADEFLENILWSCRGAGGSWVTGATKILFVAFLKPTAGVEHRQSTCPAGVPALPADFQRRLKAATSPRPQPTDADVSIKLTKRWSTIKTRTVTARPEAYRVSNYNIATTDALLTRSWFKAHPDGHEYGHEDIMELFESAAAARAAARAFADGKIAKSKWTEVVEPAPKRRRR